MKTIMDRPSDIWHNIKPFDPLDGHEPHGITANIWTARMEAFNGISD
jgi:hypothetical protein